MGEIVVNNARRLLSSNDEILNLTSGRVPRQTLRLGIPVDYAGSRIPAALSRFRERWPDVGYHVGSGPVEEMLRDLQHGVFDIVLATFTERPTIEARHIWTQELVWVHSDALKPDLGGAVPLVSYGEDSTCQRAAVAALHRAGFDCNFVFTSQSNASLLAAVAVGFGVMVVPRGRAIRNNLVVWEDSPLPKLPELYCALVVREGGNRTAIEELADYLEEQIRRNGAKFSGLLRSPRREPTGHSSAQSGTPGVFGLGPHRPHLRRNWRLAGVCISRCHLLTITRFFVTIMNNVDQEN